MTRINADLTLIGVTKEGLRVETRLTRNPLTVCRAHEPFDAIYYCIRRANHEGRHRYGIVIEGTWTSSLLK